MTKYIVTVLSKHICNSIETFDREIAERYVLRYKWLNRKLGPSPDDDHYLCIRLEQVSVPSAD